MTTATDPAGMDYKIPSPDFYADYEVGGDFTPPPPPKAVNEKGKLQYVVYTATLPGIEGLTLGKTNDGWLKVIVKDIRVSFTNAQGQAKEYVIGQTHIGSAQYNKKDSAGNVIGQRKSSPLGDFFRGVGVDLAQIMPTTKEQYEELLHAVAGRQAQITVDWTSYDSDQQRTVAGKFEDYPLADEAKGPNSERTPFVTVGGKNFWARANVKRWISAV